MTSSSKSSRLIWILAPALLAGSGLFMFACPGDEKQDGSPEPSTSSATEGGGLEDSWMFRVAEAPERLGPLEKDGALGNAWLDFYHNDLGTAANAFSGLCTPSDATLAARADAGYPCIGAARTHLEWGRMLEGAFHTDRVARRQFYKHRRKNAQDVLGSKHQPFFEGLNLLVSGVPAGKEQLATYATAGDADPFLAALAKRISEGWGSDPLVDRIWGTSKDFAPADASLGLDSLPASEATDSYRQRLVVMEALGKGDLATAQSNLRAVREQNADLLERLDGDGETILDVALFHFDSTFLRSLARLHALMARDSLGGASELQLLTAEASKLLGQDASWPASVPGVVDGLPFVVFSSWLTPADRLSDMKGGSRPASLERLGSSVSGLLATPRQKVADLDSFIRLSNGLRGQLVEAIRGTSPNGSQMDQGMGLSERFVGRLLIDGAADLQSGMKTRLEDEPGADMETAGVKARSLYEDALDKNPSPPSKRLVKAGISYRNDPPMIVELARANLDTKRPYYANEYIRPLTEVHPELLPVRESLTALDSAWNPMRKGSVQKQ